MCNSALATCKLQSCLLLGHVFLLLQIVISSCLPDLPTFHQLLNANASIYFCAADFVGSWPAAHLDCGLESSSGNGCLPAFICDGVFCVMMVEDLRWFDPTTK
jgi:hypothetical protein